MNLPTQPKTVVLLLGILIITACGIADAPSSAPTAAPSRLLPTTATHLLPSNRPPPTPVPSGNYDVWLRGWLLGQPCAPPCWEGITPGKTSREAALALLTKKPFIIDLDGTLPANPADETGSIGWNMGTGSTKRHGEAIFDNNQTDYRIRSIWLDLPNMFQLSDVIARYGPPSHVLALAGRARHEPNQIFYDVNLIFLEHGFTLCRTNLRWGDAIEERMYLSGVSFFEPTIDSFKDWRFLPYQTTPRIEALQPWHGFDTFGAYCQPEEDWDSNVCAQPPTSTVWAASPPSRSAADATRRRYSYSS